MKIEKNVAYRTRDGQKAVWDGYTDSDGDYRILVGRKGCLYRSDGIHGGYTGRVTKRPGLDIVGLWEEPSTSLPLSDLKPQIGDMVQVTHMANGDPVKDGQKWIIRRVEENLAGGKSYYGAKIDWKDTHKGVILSKGHRFKIVSKATEEPWSIFNNKIPFGLLDEDQQQQLKDWHGEYVYWLYLGKWVAPSETCPSWHPRNVYRAVPEQEQTVEEQVEDTALKQLWELVGADNQTEAVNRIKRLIDVRKGVEGLLNDLR